MKKPSERIREIAEELCELYPNAFVLDLTWKDFISTATVRYLDEQHEPHPEPFKPDTTEYKS